MPNLMMTAAMMLQPFLSAPQLIIFLNLLSREQALHFQMGIKMNKP
ncbi:MAG: hypothetical protein HZC10_05640 [Nitrospirae bacterium]|nr:hypothetical protein [Nitrospirota bacterium]